MRLIPIIFLFVLQSCRAEEAEILPECANGQSYWCQNVTTAVACSAWKHCYMSVWMNEQPIEEDRSETCSVCLKMVKEARDQLLSNMTQTEMMLVLEGSCELLIPIPVIRRLCIETVDKFAPELTDAIASRMNPSVVCSVAGLCYNDFIHKTELQYKKSEARTLDCNNCNGIIHHVYNQFRQMDSKDFLSVLFNVCAKLGSYSDGCYSIAVAEHMRLHSLVTSSVDPQWKGEMCNLIRVCTEPMPLKHHYPVFSASYQRLPLQDSADVELVKQDDLPCDLCVQLTKHLRDILVSNTTEEQFEMVLEGICGQMGEKLKTECIQFAKTYFKVIYQFLTDELEGKSLCEDIYICPRSNNQGIRPLLIDVEQVDISHDSKGKLHHLPLSRMDPITRIPAHFLQDVNQKDATLCSLCELILHYVQQEITLPSTEEEIRRELEMGCSKLPRSIVQQCDTFVETYMDQLVALLSEEIDPSVVCPKIGVCPGASLISVSLKDKPNCPLCLLATQSLSSKLKNVDKTIDTVNSAIDDLCIRDEFPSDIALECVSFISSYRSILVDMVIAEFPPQESCLYMELCTVPKMDIPSFITGNTNTNEIVREGVSSTSEQCVICEFIMSKLEILLKDKKVEEEIREAVSKVCDFLPHTVSPKCHKFVSEYAELVIELLAEGIAPRQICTMINLCKPNHVTVMKGSLEKCLVCELVMDSLRTVISDPTVEDDINKQLELACNSIPAKYRQMCLEMVGQLAPQIESALGTLPIGRLICSRIGVCNSDEDSRNPVQQLDRSRCRLGSSYWCLTPFNAAKCNAVEFCQAEVWKANKPRPGHNKGTVVIHY